MNLRSAVITRTVQPFGFIARGLGLVYLWFGALKFFPGLSPAEALAGSTIEVLTLGMIGPSVGLIFLALWEFAIGFLLMTGICRKCALTAALLHIVLTFTPLFFFPELCFTEVPFGLTLVGQYIIKNVVFLGIMIAMYRRLPGPQA